MNILEQISHETMMFMRGKYRLDEIGDGKDELKFKRGQKTILTIYIHSDRYTFLLIFGRKERDIFEARKQDFSQFILDHYEGSKTYHDGKWMFIDVETMEQLEEVKKANSHKEEAEQKTFLQRECIVLAMRAAL